MEKLIGGPQVWKRWRSGNGVARVVVTRGGNRPAPPKFLTFLKWKISQFLV